MKIKHSKFRNTGLIFEILSKQLVMDVLSTGTTNSSKIIKKHFNKNSELFKEIGLYQSLLTPKISLKSIPKLVDVVVNEYKKLNHEQLRKEKYNLISDIKKYYPDINTVFSIKTENYQKLGNIYRLFEYSPSIAPVEYAECHSKLIEQLSHKPTKTNDFDVLNEQDETVRNLTLKMLIKKFNEKYSSLNESQKTLISKYLNSNPESIEFKEYVLTEIKTLKSRLATAKINNVSLEIKLLETTKLLDDMVTKNITENTISGLLKFYELEKLL